MAEENTLPAIQSTTTPASSIMNWPKNVELMAVLQLYKEVAVLQNSTGTLVTIWELVLFSSAPQVIFGIMLNMTSLIGIGHVAQFVHWPMSNVESVVLGGFLAVVYIPLKKALRWIVTQLKIARRQRALMELLSDATVRLQYSAWATLIAIDYLVERWRILIDQRSKGDPLLNGITLGKWQRGASILNDVRRDAQELKELLSDPTQFDTEDGRAFVEMVRLRIIRQLKSWGPDEEFALYIKIPNTRPETLLKLARRVDESME